MLVFSPLGTRVALHCCVSAKVTTMKRTNQISYQNIERSSLPSNPQGSARLRLLAGAATVCFSMFSLCQSANAQIVDPDPAHSEEESMNYFSTGGSDRSHGLFDRKRRQLTPEEQNDKRRNGGIALLATGIVAGIATSPLMMFIIGFPEVTGYMPARMTAATSVGFVYGIGASIAGSLLIRSAKIKSIKLKEKATESSVRLKNISGLSVDNRPLAVIPESALILHRARIVGVQANFEF